MKFALVLLSALLAAQAPAPKEVPVAQEPSHHLVFENQYTRVYQVEVSPGKATLLHRHDHDYVFVVLGDAHISNDVLGQPPRDQQVKDGDVNFAAGGFAHVARNVGATSFRNVTIEVLRKSSGVVHGGVGGKSDGASAGIVFATDTVIVRRYDIEPGRTLPMARDNADHLLVPVTDLHLESKSAGNSAEIQRKAGDVIWVTAELEHTLTNVGKTPVRFVTVEFR